MVKNSNETIMVPVANIAKGTWDTYRVKIYSLITGVPIMRPSEKNMSERIPKNKSGL